MAPLTQLAVLFSLLFNANAFVVPFSKTNGCSFVARQVLFSETPIGSVEETSVDSAEEAPLDSEEPTSDIEESAAASLPDVVVEENADGAEITAEQPAEEKKRHTLFIGNLPFGLSDMEVKELFAQHGTVELVSVPKHRETGQSRGFAFIDMSTPEELQAAIDGLDGFMVGGRNIRVQESLPKGEFKKEDRKKTLDEGKKKLYVGNLSFDTTRDDLMEYFGLYGEVFDVYIPLDSATGSPRGFAFITMDEAAADEAIEKTNGEELMGRKITVSLPLPPGEKKTQRQPRIPLQKLYVGNLSFYTVTDTLREFFGEFGEVYDCYMPEDPNTGETRGFGFVTMLQEDAQRAIDETDGCELDGRIIRVNEAQPKVQREEYSNYD